MLELFRDSAWTFVDVVVALTAIAVAVAIYFAQKRKKGLLVETIANVPLLTIGKNGIDGLEIKFQGKPLDDAVVVLARVINSGNTPILASDYEQPVTFEFWDRSSLLSADVIATQPGGIPIKITIGDRLASLSSHLLNPADSVTCRFLLTDSNGQYLPRCRIAGVQQIEKPRSPSRSVGLALTAIVLFLAVFIAFLYLDSKNQTRVEPPDLFVFTMMVVSGFGVLGSGLFIFRELLMDTRRRAYIWSSE